LVVQAEDGGYDPPKAKYIGKTLIAYKYREGTVQRTSKEELKGRETAYGEPGLLHVRAYPGDPPARLLGVFRWSFLQRHRRFPTAVFSSGHPEGN